MGSSSPRRGHLLALAAFVLLAFAYTWPLGAHLGSRVAHDLGDPVLNTWILWWNAQAPPFSDRWWSPPVFVPMEGAFALSEHLVGIALFATPLQWLGLSALAAYNLALIFSFALTGFFTYLLVTYLLLRDTAGPTSDPAELEGRAAVPRLPRSAVTAGALAAGIAFGFAPYRADQLAHLQVLTTQWMPVMLLAMHAYMDGGRRRWLLVAGLAWVVQALSNGYYLLFMPVLVGLWLAGLVDWRHQWRRGFALLAAFAGSSLLLLPGLLRYKAVHGQLGLLRHLEEMRMYSADPVSFLAPPGALLFWPHGPFGKAEAFLFPGLTVVVLVLAGVALTWRRRAAGRTPMLFYAAAALAMFWLALGPALPGEPAGALLRPYTLLTFLPGFDGLRVPARIAMLGFLCLAIAAGLALARLLPAGAVLRRAAIAVALVGLLADGWPKPMPLLRPPGRAALPDMPGAAVVELPADNEDLNVAAMFRAMTHGYPLVNGYSGHVPPHYRILRDSLRRGDPTGLQVLAERRPLIVSIDGAMDQDGHFQRVVESVPGVAPLGATTSGRLFLVPAQPAVPPAPLGPPLPFTLVPRPRQAVELDIGSVRTVRVLEIRVGRQFRDLDARIEILASEDGDTWREVWLDWTAGPALRGALEDAMTVPWRLTLPDVRARYLRVRPLHDAFTEEIAVYGPR
jgi:hypothetical protein